MATLVASIAVMQGCASTPDRNPVPQQLYTEAEVPGVPRARFWGDEAPPFLKAWLAQSQAELEADHPGIINREHNYLAISGGGARGAYGAGVLVGWSDTGTRPEFTIVTGVSTGALIAPFAFLGPDYDDELEEMYTAYSTKDLVRKLNKATIIWRDSAVSSEPLRALIAQYIDEAVLEALGVEHRRGRRLWIATTNLDAGRPVLWNVSAIAASGSPQALELVHDVMLASASIPGAFPPLYIEVEVDGKRYDEMHVDGGTTTQINLYPVGIDWREITRKLGVKGQPTVYVIRNALLDPEYKPVKPRLVPIAGSSISALIRTQGIGDMYRIYLGARRDEVDYRLTFIPSEFTLKPTEMFDPEYMKQLFELGRQRGRDGTAWQNAPPGLEDR
ncbi:MAG: patatin-like phospholipase family protein [Arenicellales bacterium]|nr:patatin-like phospholipase family protein [Arenicellales bacterium]